MLFVRKMDPIRPKAEVDGVTEGSDATSTEIADVSESWGGCRGLGLRKADSSLSSSLWTASTFSRLKEDLLLVM